MNNVLIPHFILLGLFILAGILSLLAALFNWNWFFNTNNVQGLIRRFGLKRTRCFYAIMGLVFITMAIYFIDKLLNI